MDTIRTIEQLTFLSHEPVSHWIEDLFPTEKGVGRGLFGQLSERRRTRPAVQRALRRLRLNQITGLHQNTHLLHALYQLKMPSQKKMSTVYDLLSWESSDEILALFAGQRQTLLGNIAAAIMYELLEFPQLKLLTTVFGVLEPYIIPSYDLEKEVLIRRVVDEEVRGIGGMSAFILTVYYGFDRGYFRGITKTQRLTGYRQEAIRVARDSGYELLDRGVRQERLLSLFPESIRPQSY